MSRSKQVLSCLGFVLALLSLPSPGACAQPAAAPAASASPAAQSPSDLARERLDTMLRSGHADPAWFGASFLAQVPADRVDRVIAGLTNVLGPYQSLELTPAQFVAHFAKGSDDVLVHLDSGGKIDGLLFKPPTIAVSAATAAMLDLQAALDSRTAAAPGTGIVVGIIDHGRQTVFVSGSSGNGRPLDEHTLFEIGSVSKTFTATALAAMVLDGRARLSDPVAKYLPPGVSVPVKDGQAITLLELAEQRSGLPRMPSNMADETADDPYAAYTNQLMYAFLSGYSLDRSPGSHYEYSNFGLGLLGQALANRDGTTYPQLIARRVLQPLGMDETSFATTDASDAPPLAVGHDLSGDAVPNWHFDSMLPAGGIRSDLHDMLAYLRCNMGQGPLARACLFAQQPRAKGEAGHDIGLVWWTNSATGVISHAGDTAGFHAQIAISKDRQTGVVVMSNGPVVTDVAAHVLSPAYPIASCRSTSPAPIDPKSYAGTYCNAMAGTTFDVAPGANPAELSIALEPQAPLIFTRVKADTYAAPAAGASVKFIDQDGSIVGLYLMQSGTTLPALRLDARGKALVAKLPSPFPAEIALDAGALDDYAGTYTAGPLTFTVTRKGNGLFVQLTGQPAAAIYPSATDEFFYKIVDAQISFSRDASGRVTKLTLHQDGHDVSAKRGAPPPP